jgi:hypothetical protein
MVIACSRRLSFIIRLYAVVQPSRINAVKSHLLQLSIVCYDEAFFCKVCFCNKCGPMIGYVLDYFSCMRCE